MKSNIKSNNPLVSVIMPVYNGAKQIRNAIKSLLNQSYNNIEILIVNDGSTDKTKTIVRSFKDKKIKLFNQKNLGPAKARNHGINNANGEYISFLDHDDTYDKFKIEKQIKEIINKKAYVNYCNIKMHDQINNEIYLISSKREQPKGYIYKKIYLVNPIITPGAILLHKTCFEKVGLFNEKYWNSYDYDFYLRLSKHYSFSYLNKPLVNYYLHGENNVLSLDKVYVEVEKIIKKENRYYKKLISNTLKEKRKLITFKQLKRAYSIKNNQEKVLEISEKIYKSFNKYEYLVEVLKYSSILKKYKLIIKYINLWGNKKQDYKLSFYKGIYFFYKNEYLSAISIYSKALKKYPTCAEIYNNLGVAYVKVGDLKSAKKYFIDSLRLNKKYNDTKTNLESINNNINKFIITKTHFRS